MSHSVKFNNESGHTLTTAPVLITENNQRFIGRDTLNFTLENNSVLIHLHKVFQICVTHDEKCPDATQSPVKIFDINYLREQWNGTITAINATEKTVKLSIKIQLYGNISKYSIPPKVDTVVQGTLLVNQWHHLRWDIKLEPQQTKVIQYCRCFHRLVE